MSVFQAISLADELECRPSTGLELRTDPALPFDNQTNLVHRAVHLLQQASGTDRGAVITLRKCIPIAAGLGGGSADAAATLVALSRLWQVDGAELAMLAEQLGSDVPYFLGTATALVRGRGERVEALPAMPALPLVLLRPPVPLATRDVFAALHPEEWSDGAATLAVAAALRRGDPLRALRNNLLAAAERCCPLLGQLRRDLAAADVPAYLSGTGPTLFVLPGSSETAQAISTLGRRLGAEAWVCRTITAPPLALHVASEAR